MDIIFLLREYIPLLRFNIFLVVGRLGMASTGPSRDETSAGYFVVILVGSAFGDINCNQIKCRSLFVNLRQFAILVETFGTELQFCLKHSTKKRFRSCIAKLLETFSNLQFWLKPSVLNCNFAWNIRQKKELDPVLQYCLKPSTICNFGWYLRYRIAILFEIFGN